MKFPQLLMHPQWKSADQILKKLKEKGFEALLAGGAVRDLIMGQMPGDLDIATSAKPDQVEALFENTLNVGKAFGVIRVLDQGNSIEVATYRQDVDYQDGRRPESVIFTSRFEDAKRRDFTINALFYDPSTETVYDDVNGIADVKAGILKCVGNAQERFHEDQLRRLRLVRFVSQLGFKIDPLTRTSLEAGIEGIKKVSLERITDEIGKMWLGRHLEQAFPIWLECGMAIQIDSAWKTGGSKISEEIWKFPRKNKKQALAHYFSFFFDEVNLSERFKTMKLSSDIKNYIQSVFEAYQFVPQFLSSRLGEQRYFLAEESHVLGLKYFICKKASTNESLKLRQFIEKSPTQLPQPLVKAAHLMPQYQGEALGRTLKLLYIEQLEQNWTQLEEALNWIKNHPVAK